MPQLVPIKMQMQQSPVLANFTERGHSGESNR